MLAVCNVCLLITVASLKYVSSKYSKSKLVAPQLGSVGVWSGVRFLARLYESTGRAIAVTPASALASALLKMLKFLVKVFMGLYLLKLLMDQVDTLHVGRYWSEVLCCTMMTHLGDLEVKATDLEILC